jgi:hypothetical protein
VTELIPVSSSLDDLANEILLDIRAAMCPSGRTSKRALKTLIVSTVRRKIWRTALHPTKGRRLIETIRSQLPLDGFSEAKYLSLMVWTGYIYGAGLEARHLNTGDEPELLERLQSAMIESVEAELRGG